MISLSEFYQNVTRTISGWHTNHTEFGAYVEWSERYWLPGDLLEDEKVAAELGWTLEEIQFDEDTYHTEYMEWYMKNSISRHGLLTWDLIQQVENVLNGLLSDDVWDCLASLVLAINLAHSNGELLADYYAGETPIDIQYYINSISQNGLEVTFPDFDEFVKNYQPIELDW